MALPTGYAAKFALLRMWGAPMHVYGAVMQFIADPFDVGPAGHRAQARPSRSIAARMEPGPSGRSRPSLYQATSHVVAHAGREAGTWLCVLTLSASLAAATTLAVTSVPQEPDLIRSTTTTEVISGSNPNPNFGSDSSNLEGEASIATAPNTARPYVPDGIPDGADARAAGKIQLDTLGLQR